MDSEVFFHLRLPGDLTITGVGMDVPNSNPIRKVFLVGKTVGERSNLKWLCREEFNTKKEAISFGKKLIIQAMDSLI